MFKCVVIFLLLFATSVFADVKYFLNIDIGKQCKEIKERRVLITSQTNFEKIWKDTFPNRSIPTYTQAQGNGLPPLKLDFTKGMVFVAFMGKNNRNVTIKVIDVTMRSGVLHIRVKKIYPKAALIQNNIVTTPYHFIWIDRITDKVVVEDIE